MKREIALVLWMIMTSVALVLCSLCRPEAAFWQPRCYAVAPRQHGIQFHISFALCTVVCPSLAAAAVARPPPPASKRPYYYREAASRRDTARPRPKEGGPPALPLFAGIKDGGGRGENSASMQAHMA